MKKSLILALACALGLTAAARSLNVAVGPVVYSFPAAEMGEALYNSATGFTIMERDFKPEDITAMYVDESDVEPGTVVVSYSATGAAVSVAGNVARLVDATVDGAHVAIVQSAETGDDTGEITYSLSGASSDGSFALDGSYKATIELRGLDLTSTRGAAMNINNGKRIAISAKSGTVNTLADAAGGSQKAALYCKGHLEFKGKGSLTVAGHTAHAISAKEYVELKNLSLTITSAIKDGINCGQYYLQESGSLAISGIGGDGVQVDFKDAENREPEDTGIITIAGGSVDIDITADACKGLKAEGDVLVSGGNIVITTSAKGVWDAEKAKTKASACIGADGKVEISGGTLTLSAGGSGGKGVSCDGNFVMSDGTLEVSTMGGVYAYVNGREYDGYTGNLDNLASDAKSSPKGVKADGDVLIDGGSIRVFTTGNGAEGIESKSTLTISDGIVFVKAYEDAINSSSHMYIRGGEITVISTNNDGLDSNGNLYIEGGTTMAFGGSSPECGIDANTEQGYSVIFTGGKLLAVGGGNSTPSGTASTQAYVSTSATATSGTVIALRSGSEELASFTVPEEYKASTSGSTRPGGNRPGGMGGSQILITCPGLTSGQSYTLTNGSSSTSVTATQRGSSSGRPW
ncbi:MAG: carbohydrate-binding domain-containing protein [Muribaculaceae bacterium]|nr:carbohydrate-binding domain-containing protein [Muribaculaceae bacterium]